MSRRDADVGLPDVGEVSTGRALVAGLSVAAAAMLVQETFMALALRAPELLVVVAPLTVLFVMTAGLVIALGVGRLTRNLSLGAASLTFFGAGFLAGVLWGLPVFMVAISATADATGTDPARGAAIIGAIYLALVAAVGALVGRYVGPWAATRPVLVRVVVACVLATAVIGLVILTVVDLSELV